MNNQQNHRGLASPSEEECQLLRQECERLAKELAEVKKEKDWCLRALKACLPIKHFDYTKEELFACLDQSPTLGEIIDELKRDPAYEVQS